MFDKLHMLNVMTEWGKRKPGSIYTCMCIWESRSFVERVYTHWSAIINILCMHTHTCETLPDSIFDCDFA